MKSLFLFVFLSTFGIHDAASVRRAKVDGNDEVIALQKRKLLSREVEANMGNVWEPFDPRRDTPFFWQIPKAGSTNALAYFTICMDLTEASRVGLTSRSDKLEIVHIDGHKFVNVDVSTPVGLEHAGRHNLAASRLADIVSSAYVSEASSRLFSKRYKGKMFALFRHPIDRLVSKFYYLQTAKHERSYNPLLARLTIEQYASRPEYVGGNWMTRMLIGKPIDPLTPKDLEEAKEIIRTKCLVGLTSEMDESLNRFEAYFGWTLKDGVRGDLHQTGEQCKHSFFYPDKDEHGIKFNTHKHPKIHPGDRAWNLLAKAAEYDMNLYQTVLEVYAEQKALFL